MVRLLYILGIALIWTMGSVSQACQFDQPGQSHEQYLEWIAARNQRNAELASGQGQTKVAKKEEKKAKPVSRPQRDYRYPRSNNGGNPVIR